MASCTSPFKFKTILLLGKCHKWFVDGLEINVNKAITSKGNYFRGWGENKACQIKRQGGM